MGTAGVNEPLRSQFPPEPSPGAPEILAQFTSPVDRCAYLPNERASLEYHQIWTLTERQYFEYLRRGWRRHGIVFFRPVCPACSKCRSLRVDVARFRTSKSQRRCWQRNAQVEVELTRPGVTDDHLAIFNRYHAEMARLRNWPAREIDRDEYVNSFLLGEFEFAAELRYFRADRLAGVGLIDITRWGMSSVYFYHDPEWRPEGPGTYSMLTELRLAAAYELPHHYLGYWIAQCGSMAYKSRYRPHEVLRESADSPAPPVWDPVEPELT